MNERYELLSEIGRGGMGVVHRARERTTGRIVAIKLLTDLRSEDAVARFVREARLLASLGEADGFVPALDGGDGPNGPYIVMPFLEGGTLAQRLEHAGRMAPDEVIALGRKLARALGRAHALGIIHRDVKPANVIFTRPPSASGDGEPLVSDLGLAKHFRADVPGASASQSLSKTGEIRGTFIYMPPEQLLDTKSVGPASDVFALGVLLYESLTGERPYAGEDLMRLLANLEAGNLTPVAMNRRDAPPALAAVIERCLAPKPEDRFADGATLERALAALARPVPRRRRGPVAVASALGLLVAAAGVIASAMLRPQPEATPARAPGSGGSEWRETWRLGAGAPPELVPAALWEDAAGRVAAPLRCLDGTHPEALAAAFHGVVSLDGGRVTLAPDLGAARIAFDEPGRGMAFGPVELAASEGALALRAPSLVGTVRVRFGAARWVSPRIALTVSEPHKESGYRFVQLFAGEQGLAYIATRRRFGELTVAEGTTGCRGPGPHKFEFAPGAPAGTRVRVDGDCEEPLDAAAGVTPPPGEVLIAAMGDSWRVSDVVISGVPARPDVRATARAPLVPAGSDARVSVTFEREPGGLGGPFVALEDGAGEGAWLELDGRDLVLRRGESVVARRTMAVAVVAGRLTLERRWDGLRATVDGSGVSETLELAAPLALDVAVRASYGSTAPRVRFDAVSVAELAGDARRTEPAAVGSWREGVRLLARVAAPRFADPAAFGPDGAGHRKSLAARARDLLARAAPSLGSSAARRDALARAAFASVLAGAEAEATELAERLAREEGTVAAAASRMDALEWGPDGPALVSRFLAGYLPLEWRAPACAGQETVVLAGAAVADALASDRGRNARVEEVRGLCAFFGDDFDGAINAWQRAESIGAASSHLNASIGDALIERGRGAGARPGEAAASFEAALERWERNVDVRIAPLKVAAIHGELAKTYAALAHERSLAGDEGAALEALLGALAHGAGLEARGSSVSEGRRAEGASPVDLAAVSQRIQTSSDELASARPGLAAVALCALVRLDADAELRARRHGSASAYALAAERGPDGPERDLGVYALACLGGPSARSVQVPVGERSTAVLVRARVARKRDAALGTAVQTSSLVEHLVRLDAELRR